MKKYFLLLLLSISACSNPSPPMVITNTIVQYPEFPPVPAVPPLNLEVFKYDLPRDSKGNILNNPNSFVCLSQNDFNTLQLDFNKLKIQIKLYQNRIDEVNNLRTQWIDLNKNKATKN